MPDVVARATVDEPLVRALLSEQHPQWATMPIRAADRTGNDHRIFRLGDVLSVRLPSAGRSVPQVRKEQIWLPRLRPALSLRVPDVLGVGVPSDLFPAPWSVYDWIPGRPAAVAQPDDPVQGAANLGAFLRELRAADTSGGPTPGAHSAWRGASLAHLDDELEALLPRVAGRERDWAEGIWRDARDASYDGPPVWVHGDVSVNNLLVQGGALHAVIDFGCAAVGDPACDTGIVWTYLAGNARDVFRREIALDDATWARGRGWALWKGLIMVTNKPPGQAELARHVLDELFAGI